MAGWYQLSSNGGQSYSFNLMDEGGNLLLGGNYYPSKAEAEAGIAAVQQNSPHADRYEKRSYYEGRLIFWLNDAGEKMLGQSGMFETEASRDAGIAATIANGPTKDIRDAT